MLDKVLIRDAVYGEAGTGKSWLMKGYMQLAEMRELHRQQMAQLQEQQRQQVLQMQQLQALDDPAIDPPGFFPTTCVLPTIPYDPSIAGCA